MIEPAKGLGLSRIHFPITALGYGRRIGIWLQGCSIRCRGCMSVDTWAAPKSLTPIDTVLDSIGIWLGTADGVSITGGEPLEQAEPLSELLRAIRRRMNGDIILFSGHDADALPIGSDEVLECIDTLVAGPFEAARPDSRPLIGSSNQVIHFITQFGRDRYELFAQEASLRPTVDLVPEGDGFWLVGIPRHGDFEHLTKLLGEDGVTLKTSAGRIGRAP